MKNIFRFTLAAAACAALVASSREAHALGPIDVEAGAKVGVGSNPSNGDVNPLGVGLGARGGVQIFGIYGGLNIVDYLGGSNDLYKAHALLYGVELGYGLKLLDLITIRPQLGIGNANFYTQLSASGLGINVSTSERTDSYLYLEPGVTGLVRLGLLFVGADLNLLAIPNVTEYTTSGQTSKTYTAMTVHGQVGLIF